MSINVTKAAKNIVEYNLIIQTPDYVFFHLSLHGIFPLKINSICKNVSKTQHAPDLLLPKCILFNSYCLHT